LALSREDLKAERDKPNEIEVKFKKTKKEKKEEKKEVSKMSFPKQVVYLC
jgi:hypothetical protein